MRLARIGIQNHSRLADLNLEVRDAMVLVGPNDVGKSSLLRCADLLLGSSTAQLYARMTIDDLRDSEQPLVIEADLVDMSSEEQALYPDEITVHADGSQTLTVKLEVTFDALHTPSIDRFAPAGGTGRQLSRGQILGIGWSLLSATDDSRSMQGRRASMLDDILKSVDLGDEQPTFDALTIQLGEQLRTSDVLTKLRGDLAAQLSKTLPEPVGTDDMAFLPRAMADNDVLSGVQLHVGRAGGVARSVSEQSDGMRAMYALALYDLISGGANMVAIDEPEVHLHPSSQRSLARMLMAGGSQKLLATHSADIVGAFPTEAVVTVKAGGAVVQPKKNFLDDDQRMVLRWWVRDRLEPLTARRVIAVEGLSDRMLVERVAELTHSDLDRLGVSLIETGGAGDMGAMWQLFGPDGFDIPLSLLIDRDAVDETARQLGVVEADFSSHSIWISERDLEEEYTVALGAEALWTAIEESGHFSANELANCQMSGPDGRPTDADVAEFCRGKSKRKAKAAMVVVEMLSEATARRIESVGRLLDEIAP